MLRKIILASVGMLASCAIPQPVETVPVPAPQVIIVSTPAPIIIQQPKPVSVVPPEVSPYVGKTIGEVMNVLGAPFGTVDPINGKRYFQFAVNPKKPNCVASYLTSREKDASPWVVIEYIAPDPKTC